MDHNLSIEKIIEELVSLGEDRAELSYWLEIYPFLTEKKRRWLYDQLSRELAALSKESRPRQTHSY